MGKCFLGGHHLPIIVVDLEIFARSLVQMQQLGNRPAREEPTGGAAVMAHSSVAFRQVYPALAVGAPTRPSPPDLPAERRAR